MDEIHGRRSIRNKDMKTKKQTSNKPPSPEVKRRKPRPSSEIESTDDESDLITNSDSESEVKPSYVEESAYRNDDFRSASNSSGSGFGIIIAQFVLVIVLLIFACIYMVIATKTNFVKEDNKEIEVKEEVLYRNCTFGKLQKKYPTQDIYLWEILKIGVEGILNKEKPSPVVYLFLKDKKPTNLVKDVAQIASHCFDPTSKPVEMKIEDFSSEQAMESIGSIIELYKTEMSEGGVTIIANLNEIPPKTVRALHFICDVHEPIVENAVIFLTLTTTSEGKKPLQIAEKNLREMWKSDLADYELDPLIARVTEQVIQLKPF